MNLEIDINDIKSSFDRISEDLIFNHILVVKGIKFRITNIEFYYYNQRKHKDSNTHSVKKIKARKRQILSGEWYLHKDKYNSNDRRKGIDYTIGDGNNFGGILIKEVIRLDNSISFSQSNFIDELYRILAPISGEVFLDMIENKNSLILKNEQIKIDSWKLENNKRKGLIQQDEYSDNNYSYELKILIK
ncbi:MAG: hypothetical protein H8E72_07460 [Candidatus Marinimicrobia bacterium]|nr:hypothetical protein [Candidatus Neomarinimicrobiota bacterium]